MYEAKTNKQTKKKKKKKKKKKTRNIKYGHDFSKLDQDEHFDTKIM